MTRQWPAHTLRNNSVAKISGGFDGEIRDDETKILGIRVGEKLALVNYSDLQASKKAGWNTTYTL